LNLMEEEAIECHLKKRKKCLHRGEKEEREGMGERGETKARILKPRVVRH